MPPQNVLTGKKALLRISYLLIALNRKPDKTRRMKKTLAVINTVVIAASIAFNSIASSGEINGNTVGGIRELLGHTP